MKCQNPKVHGGKSNGYKISVMKGSGERQLGRLKKSWHLIV